MQPLNIGNRPYVCINDQLLLVIANWEGKLQLLYSNLKPRLRTSKEIYSFNLSDRKSGFYWKGTQTNLYSSHPTGIITGASFEGTLFKFFNWVIRYNNINLPPALPRALVARALNVQGFEDLPDPLPILEYSWVQDSDDWRQRGPHEAAAQQLFRTIVPTGLVEKDPVKRLALRGIAIQTAPPSNEVLHPKLFTLYLDQLPKIRNLLRQS